MERYYRQNNTILELRKSASYTQDEKLKRSIVKGH